MEGLVVGQLVAAPVDGGIVTVYIYWRSSYLRVSQMNERSTSITTSLLMSYGILDYRWQPSNNSSISAPHSPPTLLLTVFHLYLESRLPLCSYLSLSCLSPFPFCLPFLIPALARVMCDMYHWLRLLQASMLTFPRASSSLPAELSAVELCWLMILIAPHTAWLSANEGASKRQQVRAEEQGSERREREKLMEKIACS